MMTQPKTKTLHPTCPSCAGKKFEIRLLKDEGVGTARCVQCSRDFLLLDSEDYWFDVIQAGYPRQSRCSCKSTSFKLRLDYFYRENGDVREVGFWTNCSSCTQAKQRMVVDINYSPTEELVTRPLTYCKNPKIFYDLKQLNMYMARADFARIVHYLGNDLKCAFVVWLREPDKWVRHNFDCQQTKRAVLTDAGAFRYLRIYAMPTPVNITDEDVDTAKAEDAFWKRHEVIRIGSPSHMCFGTVEALIFYISFSNEHIDHEQVIQKPQDFRDATKKLHDFLKAEFVSWRGPNCFDTPLENIRVFGDRFAKGKKPGDHAIS